MKDAFSGIIFIYKSVNLLLVYTMSISGVKTEVTSFELLDLTVLQSQKIFSSLSNKTANIVQKSFSLSINLFANLFSSVLQILHTKKFGGLNPLLI